MLGIIRHSVRLAAPAEHLFAAYLDPHRHAAITGWPVVIAKKAGLRFFGLQGRARRNDADHRRAESIVQSWSSSAFKRDDDDSTLILLFRQDGDRGRIELTHVHLPGHDVEEKLLDAWRRVLARGADASRAP